MDSGREIATQPDSFDVMERALPGYPILGEPERANFRAKARDLAEERTVWESRPSRLQIEVNRRCQLR